MTSITHYLRTILILVSLAFAPLGAIAQTGPSTKLTVTVTEVISDHEIIGTVGNGSAMVHLEAIDLTSTLTVPTYSGFGPIPKAEHVSEIFSGRTYQFAVWPHGGYRFETTDGKKMKIESYTGGDKTP